MSHTDLSAILMTLVILALPTALFLLGALIIRILDHRRPAPTQTLTWDHNTRRWTPVPTKKPRLP